MSSTAITFAITEDQIETLANHFNETAEDENTICELLNRLIDEA